MTVEELVEARIEGWWVGLVIVSNELKGIWPDLVVMGLWNYISNSKAYSSAFVPL